jgi:hypothetical protein
MMKADKSDERRPICRASAGLKKELEKTKSASR